MLRLERVEIDACDWEALDTRADRVLFQTRAWLAFLAATQGGEPVVALLLDGTSTVGQFTGMVVRRFGIRILGSPFPGWTTPYMGFNLDAGVSRLDALDALAPFAFGELGCLHLELRDRSLAQAAPRVGWQSSPDRTFLLDIGPDEDELLSRMSSSRRRNIRQAERLGVVVEEAKDAAFADEFHLQLQDVFAKQSIVPTYGVERVRQLIRHMGPTGNLLLLRARDPDGRCIATGIYPAFGGTAYFWGGASWREHQKLRPNEAVMWRALTYWKKRGVREFDLGGGAEYKRSWGRIRDVDVPYFRRSRHEFLHDLRTAAKRTFRLTLSARGRVRTLRPRRPGG